MKTNLFEVLDGGAIRCVACAHRCVIKEGRVGICGIRRNSDSSLVLDAYGSAASLGVDVIEKKPLYHFLPNSKTFSFGTLGCNFKCDFCQNHDIAMPGSFHFEKNLPPRKAVDLALENGCKSISYTYTEPAIFAEYVIDTAIIARSKGLRNILVTNGFFSQESLVEFAKVVDAVNIDLKSFSQEVYRTKCKGRIEPVLRSIEFFHKHNVWVEVTTLLIPNLNDSVEEITKIAKFIASIDKDIPWHISRFYPSYKMSDKPPTPIASLLKAKQIGLDAGLSFVYIGNVPGASITNCPMCGKDLIVRDGFTTSVNLKKDRCVCGYELKGVFDE